MNLSPIYQIPSEAPSLQNPNPCRRHQLVEFPWTDMHPRHPHCHGNPDSPKNGPGLLRVHPPGIELERFTEQQKEHGSSRILHSPQASTGEFIQQDHQKNLLCSAFFALGPSWFEPHPKGPHSPLTCSLHHLSSATHCGFIPGPQWWRTYTISKGSGGSWGSSE